MSRLLSLVFGEEGETVRLASEVDLAPAVARLAAGEPPLTRYCAEMLSHPTASRCLRNYVVLTERPEWIGVLALTEDERFWSRYYWYARFAREWQATVGYDAGLEQSVFKLLESGVEHGAADIAQLPDVQSAVERDAVILRPR